MVMKTGATILAGALLAGCAIPYSPVPVATNFPTSDQATLRAASHWNVIASHLQQRLAAEMKKSPQRPVHFVDKPDASPFQRAMTSQMITALVNGGYVVSRSPAGALKIDMELQAVSFAPDRQQYRYAGALSALANGVWVLSSVDPTVGAVAVAAAADTYYYHTAKFSPGATPQTEIIVTLSLSDQYRYYARTSSAYYVAESDKTLYGFPDDAPKESQIVKTYQVRGDR